VLSDVDFQKKYKEEYTLLKENGLLRKPDIPIYIGETKVTEEQKKDYLATYWTEYIRQLDMTIGLTEEEIEEQGGRIVGRRKTNRKPTPETISALQRKASTTAQRASKIAERELKMNIKTK